MNEPPPTPAELAEWTDRELLDAWLSSEWQLGDVNSVVLATEIERRGVDW